METLSQYNERRNKLGYSTDALSVLNNERESLIMATVIDADKIGALLATTRERGGYVRVLDKLIASDDAAWDLTDDFTGKNLNSVKQGFVNALKNDDYKGKARVVVAEDRVYLIKL